MPRALPHLALIAALALLLTACAPASKAVAPEPTAVAAPFASEEEALAAAVEAYARFVEVSDAIGHDGGRNAERLKAVSTGETLNAATDGFTEWVDGDWRQIGTRSFHTATLQQTSIGPTDAVVIYLCEDISSVDVIDGSGQTVVSPTRSDSNYFLVGFDLDTDGGLLVSSRERWDERAC